MRELPLGLCFNLESRYGIWEARLWSPSYPEDKLDIRVKIPDEWAEEFNHKIEEVDEKIRNLEDERQQIIQEFMKNIREMIEE